LKRQADERNSDPASGIIHFGTEEKSEDQQADSDVKSKGGNLVYVF
jgi:hypothetical protein